MAHLDAVLAEHGHLSATELKDLTYETKPMLEVRDGGERGGFLDLGESAPLPDLTGAVEKLQQQLTEFESRDEEDGPAPAGCSEELLVPLQSARAEANRTGASYWDAHCRAPQPPEPSCASSSAPAELGRRCDAKRALKPAFPTSTPLDRGETRLLALVASPNVRRVSADARC